MEQETELILFFVIIIEIVIVALGTIIRFQGIEKKIDKLPQVTEQEE
jgi:uncharacterized membrane protein YidH (DUF202 family)